MSLKPIAVALNEANDPKLAHRGLDVMLEGCGPGTSSIVIVYEPGKGTRMRYYGRELTGTEMTGIFATLMMGERNG